MGYDSFEIIVLLRAYFEILLYCGETDARLPAGASLIDNGVVEPHEMMILKTEINADHSLTIVFTPELYEFIENLSKDVEVRYWTMDTIVELFYYIKEIDWDLSKILRMLKHNPKLDLHNIVEMYPTFVR